MREIYRTLASNGDNVLNLAAKSDFANLRQNVDRRSGCGRGRLLCPRRRLPSPQRCSPIAHETFLSDLVHQVSPKVSCANWIDFSVHRPASRPWCKCSRHAGFWAHPTDPPARSPRQWHGNFLGEPLQGSRHPRRPTTPKNTLRAFVIWPEVVQSGSCHSRTARDVAVNR